MASERTLRPGRYSFDANRADFGTWRMGRGGGVINECRLFDCTPLKRGPCTMRAIEPSGFRSMIWIRRRRFARPNDVEITQKRAQGPFGSGVVNRSDRVVISVVCEITRWRAEGRNPFWTKYSAYGRYCTCFSYPMRTCILYEFTCTENNASAHACRPSPKRWYITGTVDAYVKRDD